VLLALLLGALAGFAADQLGLLARGLAARLGQVATRPRLQADWLRAAAPLLARRAAMLQARTNDMSVISALPFTL